VSVPTYWDYLRLDKLLSLQGGLEDSAAQLMPDELHFIIVHQAFELWFKLVLRELRLARDHLAAPRVPEDAVPHVVHHLRRTNEILRLCRDQFRIMETLTPQDFLAFRDKLIPASGFQSFQMRELEILLGLEESQRYDEAGVKPMEAIRALAEGSPAGALAQQRVDAVRLEKTLRSCLHGWLFRTPIQGSEPDDAGDDEAVRTFIDDYLQSMLDLDEGRLGFFTRVPGAEEATTRDRLGQGHALARSFLLAEDVDEADRTYVARVRAGLLFIESYRRLPLLAWPRILIDTIVELEENLVLWRTHHARMVERVIGRRIGTGGSSGVGYLDQTTNYRIFTSLWTVRTLLLPADSVPELRHPERYGFAEA
jgi:tryptophan 2,3-dioxygenase